MQLTSAQRCVHGQLALDSKTLIFIALVTPIRWDVISQRQLNRISTRFHERPLTSQHQSSLQPLYPSIPHPFITDSRVWTTAISRQELMRLFRSFGLSILRLCAGYSELLWRTAWQGTPSSHQRHDNCTLGGPVSPSRLSSSIYASICAPLR